MAQAVLETLLYREYLKRRMAPEEAAAKAQEAAAAYKAQTGLSEEEIVAGMRQQQEAADWKSFANQVLTKSPVLSDMPRRASTQRVLGASALTSSVNPQTRELGETTLQNSAQDPAVRAALAKTVADQVQAQRTALFDEKMRRGAVPLTANASPEAIAHAESVRRPYDTSGIIADQDRKDRAETEAKTATVREALGLQEGQEPAANGQSYRYDVPVTSRPFQPASDQAKDILRARLAVPVAGSIPVPEGTDVSEFGALDYVEKPQPSAVSTAMSLPQMARPFSSNMMEYRGGAYTPGASDDRTMRVNMPGLFPADSAPAARTTATAVNTAARPTPPLPMARPSDVPRGESASLMSRFFGGPEYQSTGQRVVKEGGQGVEFGSSESPADFFRASRALKEQRPEMFERQAEARGGAPKPVSGGGGKDAAMHKALEIIHHLLVRGR